MDNGYDHAPKRYTTESGEEAINIIATSLNIMGFSAFCIGNAQKYLIRKGKALEYVDRHGNIESEDIQKAVWYTQMLMHMMDPEVLDPRCGRKGGFAPIYEDSETHGAALSSLPPWLVEAYKIKGMDLMAKIDKRREVSVH